MDSKSDKAFEDIESKSKILFLMLSNSLLLVVVILLLLVVVIVLVFVVVVAEDLVDVSLYALCCYIILAA